MDDGEFFLFPISNIMFAHSRECRKLFFPKKMRVEEEFRIFLSLSKSARSLEGFIRKSLGVYEISAFDFFVR